MALQGWGHGCCVLCCTSGLGGLLTNCIHAFTFLPRLLSVGFRLLWSHILQGCSSYRGARASKRRWRIRNRFMTCLQSAFLKVQRTRGKEGIKIKGRSGGEKLKPQRTLWCVLCNTFSAEIRAAPSSGVNSSSACRAPILLPGTRSCVLLHELHSRSTLPILLLPGQGKDVGSALSGRAGV